jgi:L-cystine transport system substrate-binding protein
MRRGLINKEKSMKIKPVLFLMVLVALVAAACAPAPTPAPVPTAVPPTVAPQPTVSADPTWDKVTASGKIVFGSSMDYLPFEGYDANLQPTGFDIALAREIGARLGLQVEFVDIPPSKACCPPCRPARWMQASPPFR